MKSILAKIVLALSLAAMTLPAFAQESTTPSHAESKEDAELREKIRERIIAKILERKHEKLREVLKLDDEQSKKFFDKYLPVEKELVGVVRERDDAAKKLLDLTHGEYTDADVDPTLNKIRDLDNTIRGKMDKLDNDLKTVLNPRQRARLMVFEHEFNRRVREEIRKRREHLKEHRLEDRPHRPGGPQGERGGSH
jgi:Spy/CpxP family protein refolding chaperone